VFSGRSVMCVGKRRPMAGTAYSSAIRVMCKRPQNARTRRGRMRRVATPGVNAKSARTGKGKARRQGVSLFNVRVFSSMACGGRRKSVRKATAARRHALSAMLAWDMPEMYDYVEMLAWCLPYARASVALEVWCAARPTGVGEQREGGGTGNSGRGIRCAGTAYVSSAMQQGLHDKPRARRRRTVEGRQSHK